MIETYLKDIALGVSIDGDPPVCLVCAENASLACGYPNLFWACNKTKECPADNICKCGNSFGDPANRDAAERIAKLIKGE